MLLVGAFLLTGLIAGVSFGGHPRNLAHAQLRLWWLAPVAVAIQVAPIPGGGGVTRYAPLAALLFSFVLLLAVAVANARATGFVAVIVGIALNLAVIAANQGMPVAGEAVETLGADPASLMVAEEGARHHLADEDTRLRPLADVIPIGGPFGVIVSVGDLLMYTGAGVFVGAATRRRRAPDRPSPAPTSPSC